MSEHAPESLWPDPIVFEPDGAIALLLRAQAELLGPKTGGLVVAVVETDADSSSTDEHGHADRLRHSLLLKLPSIKFFRYRLLSVTHGREQYPAIIQHGECTSVAHDEAGLLWFLARTLGASETALTIANLMSTAGVAVKLYAERTEEGRL